MCATPMHPTRARVALHSGLIPMRLWRVLTQCVTGRNRLCLLGPANARWRRIAGNRSGGLRAVHPWFDWPYSPRVGTGATRSGRPYSGG